LGRLAGAAFLTKGRAAESKELLTMSFVPIEGALGAVKTGFDLIKGVRELLKKDKVNPTEVSSQLLELQELLLQAKSSLVDASEYIAKLEGDLAAQLQIDELEKLMFYDQTVYWKRTENLMRSSPIRIAQSAGRKADDCHTSGPGQPKVSTPVR
jgi:hypothetical protein